jgi:protein-disulfide isomerase
MRLKQGWLIVLVVAVLLVASCGGSLEGATTAPEATQAQATAAGSSDGQSAAAPEEEPAKTSTVSAVLPVDSDDWHILGSPDAPVTIVEYSDFQ